MAAQSRRPARSSVAASRYPEVRASTACDWRAAYLFHVFAGARGKRSCGGSCPGWHCGMQGRRFKGRAGTTAAGWRAFHWTRCRVASHRSLSKNNSRRASLRRLFRRDDRTRIIDGATGVSPVQSGGRAGTPGALHEQWLADFEIHRAASHDFLSRGRSLGHDHARGAGFGNRRRRNWRGLRLEGRRRRRKHANFADPDAGIL